ncbi:MAG: low molecular weight protein arginine phosphatase [Candidatus Caldatribacteriota bacterium]|nr:low molecular weight protein arginine phosphatase [Candidatus Caldatribacteriota bacterium]
MIKNILFVCTGNTCRSIMAEGIFKKIKKISNFEVKSAGTNVFPGMSPTQDAISVMREENIDISRHKATQLTKKLIDSADYIFTMTNYHLEYVLKLNPEKHDKIFLLKKFAIDQKTRNNIGESNNDEISDPIGKGIEFYRIIAKELKKNLVRIISKIIKENK